MESAAGEAFSRGYNHAFSADLPNFNFRGDAHDRCKDDLP